MVCVVSGNNLANPPSLSILVKTLFSPFLTYGIVSYWVYRRSIWLEGGLIIGAMDSD